MTLSLKVQNLILLISLIILNTGCMGKNKSETGKNAVNKIDGAQLTYELPSPSSEGTISVETALAGRRSHRSFIDEALTSQELSQILWAAYGVTKPMNEYHQLRGGLRTAPSAGALYPLELYVLIGNVRDIEPGVYKYIAEGHKITRIIDKDLKPDLCMAALNQDMIKAAPACLFYSAVFERTTQKYGNRGRERYVCMDLGHSAENVYLQAEALHLGTCAIGAFNDAEVRRVMQLPENEEPLYIMPVGRYFNKKEL